VGRACSARAVQRLVSDVAARRSRAKQSGFAGKNINQRMSTSPCKVTDPQKLESAATECKSLHCTAMGCESGRQDSNLRPVVPQISPHSPINTEFDLEWFCGELVGMTTSARVMESAGIASPFIAVYRRTPSPLSDCSRASCSAPLLPPRPHTSEPIDAPKLQPAIRPRCQDYRGDDSLDNWVHRYCRTKDRECATSNQTALRDRDRKHDPTVIDRCSSRKVADT
jgi:hypothetical protein